jgi:hypothetical protein
MVAAGQQQGVPADRISFIDVLRWLTLRRRGDPWPRFRVNPLRPGRHEPRKVKRRNATYGHMTRPRRELRKRLETRQL